MNDFVVNKIDDNKVVKQMLPTFPYAGHFFITILCFVTLSIMIVVKFLPIAEQVKSFSSTRQRQLSYTLKVMYHSINSVF